jgi:hypothetical protein
VDYMSDDLAVSRVGAIVAGAAASAGVAFTVAWWIDPAFANVTGEPVMLVGFLFTLAGLGTVIALGSGRGREFLRSGLSTPWTGHAVSPADLARSRCSGLRRQRDRRSPGDGRLLPELARGDSDVQVVAWQRPRQNEHLRQPRQVARHRS